MHPPPSSAQHATDAVSVDASPVTSSPTENGRTCFSDHDTLIGSKTESHSVVRLVLNLNDSF